jgi:hypothetical protein
MSAPQSNPEADKKKPSLVRRFVSFLSKSRENDGAEGDTAQAPLPRAEAIESIERTVGGNAEVMEFLSTIETQLGSIDTQNKLLLEHLNTIKENNRVLLEQVHVLSVNNNVLYQQFQQSRKRETLSKVIAIISSSLAIGYSLYRFILALYQEDGLKSWQAVLITLGIVVVGGTAGAILWSAIRRKKKKKEQ